MQIAGQLFATQPHVSVNYSAAYAVLPAALRSSEVQLGARCFFVSPVLFSIYRINSLAQANERFKVKPFEATEFYWCAMRGIRAQTQNKNETICIVV